MTTTPTYLSLNPDNIYHRELLEIFQIHSFKAGEAPIFLERVSLLKHSIIASILHRSLEILHLSDTSSQKKYAKNPLVDNRVRTHSDIIYDTTLNNVESAFSFLETPLRAVINKTDSLLGKESTVSLPEKTSIFFIEHFFGKDITHTNSRKKPITPRSDIETCISMAIPQNTLLEASSNQEMLLKPIKENFFMFLGNSDLHPEKFSPQNLSSYFIQIAEILEKLHKMGIVLEDFKAEHILVTQENEKTTLKLCGLSHAGKHGMIRDYLDTTFLYAPPSKFVQDSSYPISTSTDCWAFGMWMCECISDFELPFGRELPPSATQQDIFSSVQKDIKSYVSKEYSYKNLFDKFSDKAKAFMRTRDPSNFFRSIILRCLDPEEKTRITMHELLHILKNNSSHY